MPTVNRKAKSGKTHTQSMRFNKEADWTKASSKEWVEEHDGYTDGYDETDTEHRWRQYDPDSVNFRYRSFDDNLPEGVYFINGYPKERSSMNLINVCRQLYCHPWAILPAMHKTLCDIVRDHMTGAAHIAKGRAELFEDVEPEPVVANVQDGIAQINLHGVIGRRVGGMEKSSGVSDLLDFEDALTQAGTNPDVRGILLSIDSPGGAVTGTPEASAKLRALSAQKPIVAHTDSLMASAAYWIGSQADVLVAAQSAEIGSIGVYQVFLDETRRAEMEGLKVELFKTGEYKGMGMPGLPLTDAQRTEMQDAVDEVFAWFVDAVTAQRPDIPVEAFRGQTYFGYDAMAMELVDTTGSFADARQELAALIASRE